MTVIVQRPSTYQPLLLSSGLHASARRTPGKRALICEGVIRTYGELAERARRVCGGAIEAGIARGDRVALLAPNCIEYPELVIGLADAGAIVTTLNPRSTTAEIVAVCNDSGARLLIIHPSSAHLMDKAQFSTVERTIVLGPDDYEQWLAVAPQMLPIAELEDTEPFTLVYSSGTTGRPKGIVISHRSRTVLFHGMAMEYGVYGPDDVQLGIAPMAHGAGFAFIMASLYFGGTVEILAKFDPERVLDKLASDCFTSVFMVPTHFQAIFGLSDGVLGRNRGKAKALRTIISNAAALPQAVKAKIVDYFGETKLHETYGSTEAGNVTSLRPQYQLSHAQSVGAPFALNAVRLLDEGGREVERGMVGELFSRSPYLFNGYWNQPEETLEAMREGWVTAGDLARQDEDGFYYIVDRKKDMVVSGGLNVYPRDIEEVLHTHPAVVEAAVVGIADDYFGETLRAFVVVRPGMHVGGADLEAHCRVTLAGYKVPKDFKFVSTLPRNAGGKVLKRDLRGNIR